MLKIAIVVQGRFHAFDVARELLHRGHDVTVFTNYPASAAARFGLPAGRVRTFVPHAVLARLSDRLALGRSAEPWLHRMFGRWAAKGLRGTTWDVIHCWSGVSEELLRDPQVHARATLLMRGSSHIRTQSRLLIEEERRSWTPLDRPSEWMIARETREYRLADHVLVLSTFSRDSFLAESVSPDTVHMIPLGVRLDAFRPPADVIERRLRRLAAGEPLRVLYVGAVSLRKGALDLVNAISMLRGDRAFTFTIAGGVLPEARAFVASVRDNARILGKIPQADLPAIYHEADLFLFPTIEDGFPAVLAQAKAAALPIVTTANGAGVDIVSDGRDGWLVPVRDPQAIVDQLRWCDANRGALASMTRDVFETFAPRDWADVAADFEALALSLVAQQRQARAS